jgi:putative transposase
VKYDVIDQMRQDYPVPPMCRLLGVSVSGYYAWRKRSPSLRAQQEPRLEAEVLAAHQRTRESFGPERLQKHLDEHGVRLGVRRIKRLRKKLGLRCRQKRKFKATTNSKHDLPVAPNLLNQDFTATSPNQAWCGDITYIATDEGWLYLAGLKDLFSGELVGYAMSERMTNAPIESFWGTLKSELVYHRRFATRDESRRAISEYIEMFYNRQRTQARLDYLSHVAFTQRYYLNQVAA